MDGVANSVVDYEMYIHIHWVQEQAEKVVKFRVEVPQFDIFKKLVVMAMCRMG